PMRPRLGLRLQLRRLSPQPPGQLARLAPLAPQLAMLLHLSPQVLGQLVNAVRHLRRGLARSQGHALEVKGALRHLVVGDRGIALLRQHDVEGRQRRDLPAEALESLPHHLTQFVRHLDVPATNLNPHECLLWVPPRWYPPAQPRQEGWTCLRRRNSGGMSTPL